MFVVIFGVAGVGKTTIGKLLSSELGWKFYDADDFHSAANIEKMRSGRPLTDEDRQSWLEQLRERIEQSIAVKEDAVVACSALKKKYRDELRVGPEMRFVYLRGDRARIAKQLERRPGHFFDPKLLDAQFADLEEPESTEEVLTVDLGGESRDVLDKIKASLRERGR